MGIMPILLIDSRTGPMQRRASWVASKTEKRAESGRRSPAGVGRCYAAATRVDRIGLTRIP